MALFNFKKSNQEPTGAPSKLQLGEPPVAEVLALREQGLSNNQIVQNLQREGFSTTLIFDAMSQADLKGNVVRTPMEPMMQSQNPLRQPGQNYQQTMQQQMPPMNMGGMPQMPPPMQGFGQPQEQQITKEMVEELTETIIDEKWQTLVQNIQKIIEWKNATENRMTRLEQSFEDLKDSYNKLHTAVVGKIGEYDHNIIAVGNEIKALEKIFQDVLPTFTMNVNELSRITKSMKGMHGDEGEETASRSARSRK